MAHKEHVKPFRATTATVIHLTQPYHNTRRRVIADSWFSSMKSAVELLKNGLYSVMLVKTAHNQFTRCLLGQSTLGRGKWVAYTATVNGHKVQACWFRDLELKDFVSTCSSSIAGKPNKTKHHGLVPHPPVAEEYLKYSASTDVHNHRTGSVGLEDIWHTKNPQRWQLAGILGFCFTNGYLAMKYFSKPSLPHFQFKMAATNSLVASKTTNLCWTLQILENNEANLHEIIRIGYSLDCYICKNGNGPNGQVRKSTTFKCKSCWIPLCQTSSNGCWNQQIIEGVPKKIKRKGKWNCISR